MKDIIERESPEQLEEATKGRVERMKAEFATSPKLRVFKNEEGYDQIIAQISVPVTAFCEHHRVGMHGDVSIAYIPGEFILGLSKLARVAEFFFNPTRYTLQERGTQQIINHLHDALEPRGLMVITRMSHDCMKYRGVKKDSITITSAVKGVFATDLGARAEFLQLVNFNGKSY